MFGLTPYERRNNDLMFFSPFKELEDMEKRFFGDRIPVNFKTDIRDTGKEFVLEAELPGFDKSDIGIDVKDGYLTITATHSEENDEKDKKGNYVRCERSYGSYARSFNTDGIDTANIKAAYTDGVLRLTLPKQQQILPASRRLEIE